GRVGPEEERPPLDVQVVLLGELLDLDETDIAPGSNEVRPDLDLDRHDGIMRSAREESSLARSYYSETRTVSRTVTSNGRRGTGPRCLARRASLKRQVWAKRSCLGSSSSVIASSGLWTIALRP